MDRMFVEAERKRGMSGRKIKAIRNSSIGLVGQIVSLCLQIISRRVFIDYIGEEILGMNNTFISVLQTISLAELGFQNAITYNLYRPLAEKDEKKINEIVNVYKIVYRCMGIFFIIASFAVLPLLSFILTDVTMTKDIYAFFLLQALASTCSYFLAYRRTILYADQKDYVYRTVDMVMNTIFKLLQIYVIISFRSYYAYIILPVVQTYIANLIVYYISSKKYPYLKKTKFNVECAKEVFADAKHIFAGRFAGYVYSSTDKLIVSKVMGTVKVTFLGNYTTITDNLRLLINSVMEPLTPIVGNYLIGTDNTKQQERKLLVYCHLRFIIALLLVVPAFVLVDDFIIMWVGNKFVMPANTKLLLMADLYLYLIQGACNDYIIGKGLFKKDKYVTIIGIAINLILSIALVGRFGIAGVLFGTVVNQIFNWIGHAWIVYRYSFETSVSEYLKYIIKNIYYIICAVTIAIICQELYGKIEIDFMIVRFICGGIVSEVIIVILYILLCCRTKEFRELVGIFLSMKKKR